MKEQSPAARYQAAFRARKRATMSPEELVEARAKEAARVKAWAKANPERVKARVQKPSPEKQRMVAERKLARALRVQANRPAQMEREKAYKADWHAKNRDKANQGRTERYRQNREAHLAKCKEYARNNREQLVAYKRAWSEANKPKLQAQARARAPALAAKTRLRRIKDIEFAITGRLRNRMRKALFAQGAKRAKAALELLGCSGEYFRAYIEAHFLPGMNWENRKEWHLDHKLPCASFDLTDLQQQLACFHYSNIRPIWGADNMRKGAKVLSEFVAVAA